MNKRRKKSTLNQREILPTLDLLKLLKVPSPSPKLNLKKCSNNNKRTNKKRKFEKPCKKKSRLSCPKSQKQSLPKSEKITIFLPPPDFNHHVPLHPPSPDAQLFTRDIPAMDAVVLSTASDTDVLFLKIMTFAKNARLPSNILILLLKFHPPRPLSPPLNHRPNNN
jgi:hypothetical protein